MWWARDTPIMHCVVPNWTALLLQIKRRTLEKFLSTITGDLILDRQMGWLSCLKNMSWSSNCETIYWDAITRQCWAPYILFSIFYWVGKLTGLWRIMQCVISRAKSILTKIASLSLVPKVKGSNCRCEPRALGSLACESKGIRHCSWAWAWRGRRLPTALARHNLSWGVVCRPPYFPLLLCPAAPVRVEPRVRFCFVRD